MNYMTSPYLSDKPVEQDNERPIPDGDFLFGLATWETPQHVTQLAKPADRKITGHIDPFLGLVLGTSVTEPEVEGGELYGLARQSPGHALAKPGVLKSCLKSKSGSRRNLARRHVSILNKLDEIEPQEMIETNSSDMEIEDLEEEGSEGRYEQPLERDGSTRAPKASLTYFHPRSYDIIDEELDKARKKSNTMCKQTLKNGSFDFAYYVYARNMRTRCWARLLRIIEQHDAERFSQDRWGAREYSECVQEEGPDKALYPRPRLFRSVRPPLPPYYLRQFRSQSRRNGANASAERIEPLVLTNIEGHPVGQILPNGSRVFY